MDPRVRQLIDAFVEVTTDCARGFVSGPAVTHARAALEAAIVEEHERLGQQAAALHVALEHATDALETVPGHAEIVGARRLAAINAALALDAGTGWVSREEHERVQTALARNDADWCLAFADAMPPSSNLHAPIIPDGVKGCLAPLLARLATAEAEVMRWKCSMSDAVTTLQERLATTEAERDAAVRQRDAWDVEHQAMQRDFAAVNVRLVAAETERDEARDAVRYLNEVVKGVAK